MVLSDKYVDHSVLLMNSRYAVYDCCPHILYYLYMMLGHLLRFILVARRGSCSDGGFALTRKHSCDCGCMQLVM